MAGRIKAEDIATVKERTSIEDVVRDHVTLAVHPGAGPGGEGPGGRDDGRPDLGPRPVRRRPGPVAARPPERLEQAALEGDPVALRVGGARRPRGGRRREVETDQQRRIDRLLALLTPVMTLAIGGGVGALIMSVMGAVLSINDLAFR